ncbi:MAG: ABC transporter permease [Candidatus Eremiobacteraeota bacterium]|nr:ABC transporter permease [Candidatus Eremiobacteraeota bacterium]
MKVFDDLGRGTTGFLEYAGGVAALGGEAGSYIGRFSIRYREVFSQMALLGVQSTIIVLLTSLFTGMVVSFESAQQAVNFGVSNLVGGAVAYTESRELGPMLSAVVVAGRAGAAITAELGAMVVTEQVEALEALGLSPIRMLVVPRLLALVVMLPVLTIIADVVGIVGGASLAHTMAGIPYDTFVESVRQMSHYSDFVKGMVKAAVFGAIITLVACYQGLNTRGGAAGVGRATTGAVVNAIIMIFVANFVLSIVLFNAG